MRNKFKRSAFFDMSDDLFYRISLIGFLVVFSSMVFFLTKYRDKKDKSFTSEPSGNAVVLEEQMMLQSRTQVDYELMTRLYKKHVGMVKMALGRGN